MKRLLALPLLLVLGVAVARATVANVSADAHVTSTLPSTNFGGRSNLAVNATSTAYVQFDLTNLPGGTTSAQVAKATMYVFVNRVYSNGTLSVAGLSSGFSELAVTYANKPAAGAAAATASVTTAGSYVAFDVTGLVQGWVTTPATNYGMALTAAGADVLLDSKENDLTGHAAYVDVTLVNQGATGAVGATGATGAQGVAGATGAAGAPGATGPFVGGIYSAATTYPAGSVVVYQAVQYVAIATTTGNAPTGQLSDTNWQPILAGGTYVNQSPGSGAASQYPIGSVVLYAGGSGATATATVTTQGPNQYTISALHLTSGGSGYPSAPTISFTCVTTACGVISGALATATVSGGAVTGLTLNQGGTFFSPNGYASITVSFSGTSATSAYICVSAACNSNLPSTLNGWSTLTNNGGNYSLSVNYDAGSVVSLYGTTYLALAANGPLSTVVIPGNNANYWLATTGSSSGTTLSAGTAAGQVYLTGTNGAVPTTPVSVTGDVSLTSAGVTAVNSTQSNAVTSASIAAGAVTNTKISAGAVTGGSSGSIAVDTVTVANLNATGTPSATTYLRGDGSWATPSGGSSTVTGANPGGFPLTVAAHTVTGATAIYYGPAGTGASATPTSLVYFAIVNSACKANATITTNINANLTWTLYGATPPVGGDYTWSTANVNTGTSYGSCSTTSVSTSSTTPSSCTITGTTTVPAGTPLIFQITSGAPTSTGGYVSTMFSCN